jgi:hypothetical protein
MNVVFACAERIKYLTMTDATKVWMPDTFFRLVKLCRIMNLLLFLDNYLYTGPGQRQSE